MIADELRRLHKQGRSLIPVGADKKSLIPWKPYQTTRASLEQLEAWQREFRPPIWAIVTGEVSGMVSLDFDVPHGPATCEKLGLTPHRSTPSGGLHVDVEHPGWKVSTVSSKTKKVLARDYPGLDVRGDGGYINVLGRTVNGDYVQLHENPPLPLPALSDTLRVGLGLAPAPAELSPPQALAELVPRPRQPVEVPVNAADLPRAASRLVDIAIRRARGDGRNNAGFWLACQLRDQGLAPDLAATAMTSYCGQLPDSNAKGENDPYQLDEALASLDQAYAQAAREPWDPRPEIITTDKQLRELTAETVDALVEANDPPSLFMRGGTLTTLLKDETGRLRISTLTPDQVRHRMSQTANWYTLTRDGDLRSVLPPTSVARDLLSRQWDELPALNGVLTAPCLRPDGSLLDVPGYDRQTGLYLDPEGLAVPPIPQHPTDTDIADAARVIVQELLGEFPFADDASRANAVGFLLTASLRQAVPGLVPMVIVDAPVQGSGKTILVNSAALIASGRAARLTTAPAKDNDEELRKRLTSILVEGESMIVFDNLSTTLSSSVLAQALTAVAWSDRLLGSSTMITIEPKVSWAVTGNNVSIGGDLARRCYSIRLDPREPQPWERDFKRPDFEGWILQHRGELVAALLTLGRAWYDRGRPITGAPRWGSYQPWTDMIHGILSIAHIDGFLANLSELTSTTDEETLGWQRLLLAARVQFQDQPFSSAQLASFIAAARDVEPPPGLAAALNSNLELPARAQRLSKRLSSIIGRRFDRTGLRIERAEPDTHTKTVRWHILTD